MNQLLPDRAIEAPPEIMPSVAEGVDVPPAVLRGYSLFAGLTEGNLVALAGMAFVERAVRGSIIFRRGDPGIGLYAVRRGKVKIRACRADGREIVFSVIQPGECFGEIALIDGRARTADAVALADCELIRIGRVDFLPFVHTNPEIALTLAAVLCGRLRRSNDQVEDIMFPTLAGRLAATVLRLARSDPSGQNQIRVTQKELGDLIGHSRESAKGGLRVLDPGALEAGARETV
jgi:CRP-like cAMP-binding protein